MDGETKGRELVFPLPQTRPISERQPVFLMAVDSIISRLWPEADWRQYVDALTNKKSVTGKWEVDRGFAAKRIQEEAIKAGFADVATAKLSKIMRAIETILRRDNLGRKQRILALNVQSAE